MQCLIDKPNPVYADLYSSIWEDYHFVAAAREKWTNQMVEQNAPYSNPIARGAAGR